MNSLLVFDLDGTLIDSAPDIIVAVNRTLNMFGKRMLHDDVIVAHIGEGLKKLIADLFLEDDLDPDKLIEIEMEFLRIYEEEMLNRTQIFTGVENFLNQYQGPFAIVTNKNEAPAKAILKHLGLDHFPWKYIFGADSLEERKPSPLPLKTVMKLTGYSPDNTFMIGDGIPDVLSALRARVPSIAIGFGYTSVSLLKQYDPKAILKSYEELPSLLHSLSAET